MGKKQFFLSLNSFLFFGRYFIVQINCVKPSFFECRSFLHFFLWLPMVISYNGTPESSESQSLHHVLPAHGVRTSVCACECVFVCDLLIPLLGYFLFPFWSCTCIDYSPSTTPRPPGRSPPGPVRGTAIKERSSIPMHPEIATVSALGSTADKNSHFAPSDFLFSQKPHLSICESRLNGESRSSQYPGTSGTWDFSKLRPAKNRSSGP